MAWDLGQPRRTLERRCKYASERSPQTQTRKRSLPLSISLQLLASLRTMPSKLVHLLVVAACCSSSSGFGPTSTVVSRIRLDLDLEQTTSLPSMTESPEGICVSEDLTSLPPVIRSIADERREFQMNLGKAMDTLRKDMPYILKRAPGMFF